MIRACLIAFATLVSGIPVLAQSLPTFIPSEQVPGIQIPQGWQVDYNEYGAIASPDLQDPQAAMMGLLTLTGPEVADYTPVSFSQLLLDQMGEVTGDAQGQVLSERQSAKEHYALLEVNTAGQLSYLNTYAVVDPAAQEAALIFFAAPPTEYTRLGGLVTAMIAFGDLDPALGEAAWQRALDQGLMGSFSQGSVTDLDLLAYDHLMNQLIQIQVR